jgi:hypothetical protein
VSLVSNVSRDSYDGASSINIIPRKSSEMLLMASMGNDPSGGRRSVKFYVSDGEVRPTNMAIRIWKRTG